MLCFLWGHIIVNLWFFSKENFENWLLWYSRSLNQTMVLSAFFLFALEGFSSKIGGSLLEFAWKSYFNYFKCLFSTKYYQNKIFWLGKIDILCAKNEGIKFIWMIKLTSSNYSIWKYNKHSKCVIISWRHQHFFFFFLRFLMSDFQFLFLLVSYFNT